MYRRWPRRRSSEAEASVKVRLPSYCRWKLSLLDLQLAKRLAGNRTIVLLSDQGVRRVRPVARFFEVEFSCSEQGECRPKQTLMAFGGIPWLYRRGNRASYSALLGSKPGGNG